jgi:ABC-2 type transport system ATP-binding protein
MMLSPLVSVEHLSKHYPGVSAVNDLSFTVLPGDVYGFLGQNGAGKSTTIRMMLTLVRPSAGTIRIFGEELSTSRSSILSRIGAVIERPDLYKYLSAYDNLAIFARMSGVAATRQKLMDQLDMVGLAERARSEVKTFSQGMKQRLGIAVALVHNPDLIILDEPTNGLDPQGIADIRHLIRRLSRDFKKTVIVSSHLLVEIEQLANRMIIIDRGKKITEGVVGELLSPENTLVVLELSQPEQGLHWLNQQHPEWNAGLTNQQIRLQLNKSMVPQLIRELSAAGMDIQSVQSRHSLEDYFLTLTNPNQHVAPVAN